MDFYEEKKVLKVDNVMVFIMFFLFFYLVINNRNMIKFLDVYLLLEVVD